MLDHLNVNDQRWVEKNMPKKYWEAVEEVEIGGFDGHWVHLKEGWISEGTGCHSIHEYTIAELKKQFKTIKREETQEPEQTEEKKEKYVEELCEEALPERSVELFEIEIEHKHENDGSRMYDHFYFNDKYVLVTRDNRRTLTQLGVKEDEGKYRQVERISHGAMVWIDPMELVEEIMIRYECR